MARKAHKVPIGELEICGIPDRWPAPPFVMRDTASILNRSILIFERSVDAWRGVAYFIATDTVEDVVIEDHECHHSMSRARRYYPWEHNIDVTNGEPRDFVTHRQALRLSALQKGATPEAIRLLHADKAFTKQEVKQMADKKNEKLAKKAPKADKAGGGDGAEAPAKKSKGNPEALKKAREAAAERGPDVRKITVLKKENPYREGSNRAASFDALKGAKTVDDYKTAGGAVKYISRWEAEGIIKLA